MKPAFYVLIVSILLTASIAFSADSISPEDAINHIGNEATVCGTVASTHFSFRSKGQPTFLNLNRPYPHHIFTALIWTSDRSKFHDIPEKYYKNKRICVSGSIEQYKGIPEIVVRNPGQMKEMK
ncbi:MAG: DNA-binding protein [Smithella sp.]